MRDEFSFWKKIISGHLACALKFSASRFRSLGIHRPIAAGRVRLCLRRYFYLLNMITFLSGVATHKPGTILLTAECDIFFTYICTFHFYFHAWSADRLFNRWYSRNITLLLLCRLALRRIRPKSIWNWLLWSLQLFGMTELNQYAKYARGLFTYCQIFQQIIGII